ncbi:MAG TPA: sigma-70 family RNA polymerase sigma factor [Armatimonadetes bacterium]|nr:sigma-70 family RNA polymerase sigma factor [Armatimonadota bacterium]
MMSAEEFEELYHQFWGLVYAKCLAYLGNPDEAEDAAMEVFLRKWCAIEHYDPSKASFKTWLMQNTNHLCIDLLRKASRRQEVPMDEVPEGPLVAPPVPDDESIDISLALNRLNPLERQLVLMRFVDEYTWQEISEATGLTVAQVRRCVNNALARLRKWLGEEEGNEN